MNGEQAHSIATMLRLAAATTVLLAGTNAFTVAPPPAPAAVEQVAASTLNPSSLLTSSTALPSQRELLLASSSTLTLASAPNSNVVFIAEIKFNGEVPTSEADEYVIVTNGGKTPADISGYYIYPFSTGSQGRTFTFPKDTVIQPGKSVRVYTNEIHKESGGYSFKSGKALWNNRGGLAILKDSFGKKVGEFKYSADS